MFHTGLLGFALVAVGVVGCASGDGSTQQQGDTLTGDSVNPTCPTPPPPPPGGAAKSFSGRAVALSVRVDLQNPSVTSWDGTVVIGDTKALGASGGQLTKSLATLEASPIVQAAVFNGAVKASGSKSSADAAIANASVLHAAPDGLLKDVLGEDGRGGTIAINLKDILTSLGITDALFANIFTGPLAGGIQADVLEENADSWCDAQGGAHSSAAGTIVRLVIGGKPIDIGTGANLKVLSLPGLVEITVNEQITTASSGASSIDATALHVNLLDGRIDVKVSRAQAGVTCGGGGDGGGGGGGGGCGSK